MASNPTRRLRMTTDLLTCLTAIPDRRRAEGKMYGQAGVILFSILAMVSGARSYRQIHTLIDRRLGLLNAAFPGAALRRAQPCGGRSLAAGAALRRAQPCGGRSLAAGASLHVGARHPPGARRGRTGTGVPRSRRGARPHMRSLTIALRCDRRQDASGQLRCLRGPKGGACAERFRRRSSDHPGP
jgi:hypothetical protein